MLGGKVAILYRTGGQGQKGVFNTMSEEPEGLRIRHLQQEICSGERVGNLQGLGAAHSIQEVQEVHSDFLASAAQPCMASREASWHLIYSVLRKLLDLCLHLQTLAPLLQVNFPPFPHPVKQYLLSSATFS